MRILVTGAFGFVGGRVVPALTARGHDVVATGRTIPAWSSSIARDTATLDVLADDATLASAMKGVDAIVHLASLEEIEAAKDPERALLVSGEGTRRLLNAAKAAGVARFVYLSTFHVYGPTAPAQLTEETAPKAAHPYGISRLAGEGFCRQANLGRAHPFAVTLRLSNGYGAPAHVSVDRWSLAHNDFCKQVAREGAITLKTPGLQHRDLVWVEDVAQAIDLVVRAPADQLGEGVFHVGGALSLSIIELAERVRRVAREKLGRDFAIVRPEPPPNAPPPPRVEFDIARLRALGYAPSDRIDVETARLLELLAR